MVKSTSMTYEVADEQSMAGFYVQFKEEPDIEWNACW